MSNECRKAMYRRLHDPAFHQRYFVGRGLDVGGGEDGLDRYAFMFPRIQDVYVWQHDMGDATYLAEMDPAWQFDFIHSSHSLEHMGDYEHALLSWLKHLRVGGHIIVTVPDFEMYEHNKWPSIRNADHKTAFVMNAARFVKDAPPVVNLCARLPLLAGILIVKIERMEATFDWSHGVEEELDQTCWGSGAAESCIEFILRKI